MKQTITINPTPGKKIFNEVLRNEPDSLEYTIEYNEKPVLSRNTVATFQTKDLMYIGVISNEWFEGAYNIPSFTCSVCIAVKDGKVQDVYLSPKNFRFPNVTFDAYCSESEDINLLNDTLADHGLRYYTGIKKVDLYSKIEKVPYKYWTITINEGKPTVACMNGNTKEFSKLHDEMNNVYFCYDDAAAQAELIASQFGINM